MHGIWLHALVKVKFASMTMRYWTGADPIERDDLDDGTANTFIAGLSQIDAPGASQFDTASDVTITITGLSDIQRAALMTHRGPATATIQLIATEDGGATWSTVGRLFSGAVVNPVLTGSQYNFEVATRSPVADHGETIYWSHADRVRRGGTSDRGMLQMAALANDEVLGVWPQV